MIKLLLPKLSVLLIVLSTGYHLAPAQTSRGTGKIKIEPRPAPPAVPRPATRIWPPTDPKVKAIPGKGSLSVAGVAEKATVLLEPLNLKGVQTVEDQVPNNRSIVVFNDLQPGRYRVSVKLDGYEDLSDLKGKAIIIIIKNKVTPVEFALRPITYNVTINTNVKTGTVKMPGRDTSLRPLQNGSATLPGLPAGTYEIEIQPGEVGYQVKTEKIQVNAEKRIFSITLKRQRSADPLVATWTSKAGWEMPDGWKAERKLTVKGAGVALPSSDQFRYYEDFELISDVRMLNDVAVSFVLRAQDSRNHYLLQVTGGKADEPHVLRGFVVKNGVATRLGNTLSVTGYAQIISSGRPFELTIKCLGNKFTVWMVDSDSGEKVALGALTDYGRSFAIGAPGLGVRDQEYYEISRFVVTLPSPE